MAATGITRNKAMIRATGFVLAGLLALVISACAPVYRNSGYVPSDEELALIEVGRDNRDSVAATLGRPSAAGLLNDVGWYYVQSRWKTFGALEQMRSTAKWWRSPSPKTGSSKTWSGSGLRTARLSPSRAGSRPAISRA